MLSGLGVNSALSMAYHLQTDGTTEWVNQEIEAYLLSFPSGNMKKELGDIEIHSQQSKTCRPTKDII
jgi:hypothetical protein